MLTYHFLTVQETRTFNDCSRNHWCFLQLFVSRAVPLLFALGYKKLSRKFTHAHFTHAFFLHTMLLSFTVLPGDLRYLFRQYFVTPSETFLQLLISLVLFGTLIWLFMNETFLIAKERGIPMIVAFGVVLVCFAVILVIQQEHCTYYLSTSHQNSGKA